MSEENILVYDDLKAKARAKGLTLSELCRKSGVKFITISKWKNANPKTHDTINLLYQTIENHGSYENKEKIPQQNQPRTEWEILNKPL